MDAPDHSWLQSNAAMLAVPGRFHERGVVAPFTTPALFGARLRPTPNSATCLEVLVPNPAGRDGWFVLPWSSVVEAYHPTLCDQALVAGLTAGGTAGLLPGRVRAAAAAMAVGGLCGRETRRAAATLLARTGRLEMALRGKLDRRAGGAGAHAARFLDCGLDGEEGLLAPRMRAVATLALSLHEGAAQAPLEADRPVIARLATRAAGVLQPARTLMEAARALMLTRLSDSAAMLQPCPELTRPDWLLDGWDLLAALLTSTPPEERASVLRRAPMLVPPLPEEAWTWPGCAGLAAQEAGGAGHMRGRAASPGRAIATAEAALARWLLPEVAPA
jgi:hypothetical protein